jgi:hypothetical protein
MSSTETAILRRSGPSCSNVKYAIGVYAIYNGSMVLLVFMASFPRLLNAERVDLEITNREPPDHFYGIMESLWEVMKMNFMLEVVHIPFGKLKKEGFGPQQ